MAGEEENAQSVNEEHEEIKQLTLDKIQELLNHLAITKVYFIDDAINTDTGKETFKGVVNSIISKGKIEELQAINLQGIDFSQEEILSQHIDEVWDDLNPGKQMGYFKKVYGIDGTPEAMNDFNVSNGLQAFFNNGQIEFLTPNEWEDKNDKILSEIPEDKKILVIFDQDLKLAEGRFKDQLVQGEQLILELKQKNVSDKVIVSLLTHTVTSCEEELPKRTQICTANQSLNNSDFFVLAKRRLSKPEMFADGLKKVCLNTFCENIKDQTISILESAQKNTIERLQTFDTYDFDHTVFKSSHHEGVWEPETLLRITDIIFKDEVRKLMVGQNYMTSVNPAICAATELSKVEFKINDSINPYSERFKLRHQEIYEAGELLNKLRKPIDNGDIFEVTDGEKKGKKFILVAQECDMMVRGKDGNRGARTAILIEVKTYTEKQLLKQVADKYQKDIKDEKINNHFFADRFKLEYFEEGKNNVGLVHFSKAVVIDLNVLDLIVFNESGEAKYDLDSSTYDVKFHNAAWQKRHDLISKEFADYKTFIDEHYTATDTVEEPLKQAMQTQFNYLFSFIDKVGIQLNYAPNKFDFGMKRTMRLRDPKSKYLLNRYYQHLSRIAEPHDFAL